MTCFKLPDTLLGDIILLLVGYWWGKKDDHKKIPWVAWSMLMRNKKDGGLGFRDLHSFNLALLAKQGWRLITQPHSLVARLLKAKYFPNSTFWEANLGSRPSFSWRSILGARKVLELGCRRRIFSGNNTRILKDPWLPRASNFRITETLGPYADEQLVSSLVDHSTASWNVDLVRSLFRTDEANLILSMAINLDGPGDRWVCHHSKNGKFTVKTAYHSLRSSSLATFHQESSSSNASNPVWSKLWKLSVPPRVCHFLWRCCTNSLPTSTNLARRGVSVENMCPFCRANDGTALHLFFHCPQTIKVWQASGTVGHIFCFEQPVFELWVREIIINGSSTVLDYLAMLLYGIWLARNKCIFDEANFLPHSIITSASRILSDFKEARGWPEIPSPSFSDIIFKLPRNCWRIYFDGAVSFRRNCLDAGVWVQSPTNDLVMASCKRFDHCIDPEVAEFRALQLAILAATDLHLEKFVIIGDALGVLQSFTDPNVCPTSCLPIPDQIHAVLPSHINVTSCWIGRCLNLISHELAYFAKNMDCHTRSWNEVPPFIVSPSAG